LVVPACTQQISAVPQDRDTALVARCDPITVSYN